MSSRRTTLCMFSAVRLPQQEMKDWIRSLLILHSLETRPKTKLLKECSKLWAPTPSKNRRSTKSCKDRLQWDAITEYQKRWCKSARISLLWIRSDRITCSLSSPVKEAWMITRPIKLSSILSRMDMSPLEGLTRRMIALGNYLLRIVELYSVLMGFYVSTVKWLSLILRRATSTVTAQST